MTQRTRRRQRHRGGVGAKLLLAGLGLVALVAIAAIAVASWVLGVAAKAPPLADCRPVPRGGNSTLFAADGSRLGIVQAEEVHNPVALRRIPRDLRLATVAIEDQHFYEDGALDPEGIARAALKDLEAGEPAQGGSTITQQLVRNLCIRHPARTLERKIIEAKLAIEYAESHSKGQILAGYLNSVPYGTVEGSTVTGVGAAARIYFSRPVWELSLAQAALLAGLPQAPTYYDPLLHPRAARVRRNEVLAKMAGLGFVPRGRAGAAERGGLGLRPSRTYFSHRQPYFFDYVVGRLIARYGAATVRRGGLKVYTTIEPRLQEAALAAMRSTLPYSTDPASALVSIDPRNGYIEAMADSTSYGRSQFNLAAQGHRQPGSTFKAFVLATALEQGIDPYTTYFTSKPLDLHLARWGHWVVHTADLGYLGRVNLERATTASDNTVFAQLDLEVGPANVAATAHAMGITTPLDGIPAEGIGGLRIGVSPLELTDAYATLAAGGVRHDPVAIRRVVFRDGRVERPEAAAPRRALPAAVAYQVTRLLHDNITRGTGTAAYTGCVGQAGKTGTTDRLTDAWFAGYQPNLATAVWVGYPRSNAIEMTSVHGTTVYGGTFPAQIWHSLYASAGVPCEEIRKPKEAISWAPYYGRYTAATAGGRGGAGPGSLGGVSGVAARKQGEEATGGYNPNAYEPGVGQKPTHVPAWHPPPEHPAGGGGESGGGR